MSVENLRPFVPAMEQFTGRSLNHEQIVGGTSHVMEMIESRLKGMQLTAKQQVTSPESVVFSFMDGYFRTWGRLQYFVNSKTHEAQLLRAEYRGSDASVGAVVASKQTQKIVRDGSGAVVRTNIEGVTFRPRGGDMQPMANTQGAIEASVQLLQTNPFK